jgi:hypothetical protein
MTFGLGSKRIRAAVIVSASFAVMALSGRHANKPFAAFTIYT